MLYSNQIGYYLNKAGLNRLDFATNFLNGKVWFRGWQGHFVDMQLDLEYYSYIKKF